MNAKWWLLGLLGLSLSLPHGLAAQTFEGVVKQRNVTVEGEALFNIMYGGEEEEPEFDSEAEWLRYAANKLFQVPIAQFRQEGMEGVEVEELTMQIKGTKIRLDSGPDAGWFMIYDVGGGQVWMVNPAGQYYVSYSMDEMAAAAEAAAKEAEEAMAAMGIDVEEMQRQAAEYEAGEMEAEDDMGGAPPTVKNLERTETINGFRASAFEAMVGDQVGLGWCAEDQQGLQATMKKIGEMAGAMEEEEDEGSDASVEDLLCEDRVPVRIQTFSLSMGMGGMYSLDEVVSIEETSVSDDVFQVPSGYTKKSLSELWGIG